MEDGCGNQPVDQAQDSTQLDFFLPFVYLELIYSSR